MVLVDILAAGGLRVDKLALAGSISEHGHFKAAACLGVSDEFVTEFTGCNFLDLLDRANGVLAIASATAVLNLHKVRGVCVLDDSL